MPSRILLALALCGCMACALAQPAPSSSQAVTYRVQVRGPEPLAGLLREGLNIVRWQHDSDMTADLLERLLDEAVRESREAIATEGYFSPEVTAVVDRSATPWMVYLSVVPGPRTLVESVDLRFSGPATGDEGARAVMERVRKAWALPPGEPFRQRAWDEAKAQAVRELSAWKYAAAAVQQSQAVVDPKTRTAALSVELASGPPFRFGPILIAGARRYVGSSRVDLQACKLEYSIVSPK